MNPVALAFFIVAALFFAVDTFFYFTSPPNSPPKRWTSAGLFFLTCALAVSSGAVGK